MPSHPEPRPLAAPLAERFGSYRILGQLGQGGMATVYLAEDTRLGRRVALKVPKFAAGADQALRERFQREARAAATLSHPNICPLYEVGEIDGTPYLTMDYVEGKPLSAFVGEKPLPQAQVALLVRKLALALAEAHERGVIHRDLKPSNVMINRRREPVVMDFGLARLERSDEARLTREGAVLGTPAYMAPEQVSSQLGQVGAASDVYSLGVMLYELLTGSPPFQGPVMAVLAQVMTQEPERPSARRSDLDPRLEAVCLRAMAKKPGDRYASMAHFAEALATYAREPATAALSPSSDAGQAFADLTLVSTTRPRPTRRPPSRGLVVAVASAAFLLLVGGITLLLNRDPAPRPSAAAEPKRTTAVAKAVQPPVKPSQPVVPEKPPVTPASEKSPPPPPEKSPPPPPEKPLAGPPAVPPGIPDGHTNKVTCVAISPDRRLLASGSMDGTIRLRDLATGALQRVIVLGVRPMGIVFQPDSRVVASWDEGRPTAPNKPRVNQLRLWRIDTGEELDTFRNNALAMGPIAYSPDGVTAATSCPDNSIRFWEAATGKPRGVLEGHANVVRSLAYDRTGKRLASGTGGACEVRVWDLATGKVDYSTTVRPNNGVYDAVGCIVFTAEGKYLVSGGADVNVWRADTGEKVWSKRLHAFCAGTIALHPGGELVASGGWEGDVNLFVLTEIATGQQRHREPSRFGAYGLVFHPDGSYLVVGGSDVNLRFRGATTGVERATPWNDARGVPSP